MTGNEIDDWELLSATDKIALERLNDTDRDLSPGTVLDQLGAVAAACRNRSRSAWTSTG